MVSLGRRAPEIRARACASFLSEVSSAIRSLRRVGLGALLLATACGGEKPTPVGVSVVAQSGPVLYQFSSLDARPVSCEGLRGRPVVMAFVTTWDLQSQAQIDFLVPLSKKEERPHYVAVAMDDAKNRELVEAYVKALHVTFAAAMADVDTTLGRGPLGELTVPTVIVFDEGCRVSFRRAGLVKPAEIREALDSLDAAKHMRDPGGAAAPAAR